MLDFDLIIVGAGPSGLAAAKRMTGEGFRVALVDSGRQIDERDRHVEADITHGHGGAGLFSDGKFSFFPSASDLWTLPNDSELRKAYDWTCDLLGSYGLDTPPFPTEPTAYTVGCGEWVLKDYPSDYLSLESRLDLTAQMVADVDAEHMVETEVVSSQYCNVSDSFHVKLRDPKGQESEVTTRRLLLASGRFGPLRLRELTGERSFRRLEVGFRIEQPAEQSFFRNMEQLDPKLRFREKDGGVEWRTFCACRSGETVLTLTQGLWTVSGHSDCPPSGRSNVGFNTRILDETVAARTLPHVLSAMAHKNSHFVVAMNHLVSGSTTARATFDRVYGSELREIMVRGLSHLTAAFPEINSTETDLIGPTLEGVGWYPMIDGHLRLRDAPAWVAGDSCGMFRGIVAALISGHYAGSSVLRDLETAS